MLEQREYNSTYQVRSCMFAENPIDEGDHEDEQA